MTFLYNPLNPSNNDRGGTVKLGCSITFTVKTDGKYSKLIIKNDKTEKTAVYEMKVVNGGFSVTLNSLEKGLYFYYFECDGRFFGKGEGLNAVKNDYAPDCYQLTVYAKSYSVPDCIKGGVIYQIFPDRFNKSGNINVSGRIMKNWGEMPEFRPSHDGKIKNNDFFGGNFKGIEEKLSYLKDLGVTAIYLNPISLSYSNHRYDTADYLTIDPLLGGEKDLLSLINSAHKKGIKLIFDGVYNHTGDDSIYFNKYGNYKELGAYQSEKSKYFSWYTFQDYPEKYTSWWGINVLPAINKNSKGFESFILNKVLPYYFNLGFDGIRLDVVDELPTSFVKKIRKTVKKLNPNAVIIGEVWEDATNKISYGARREYFWGDELDAVMNYPLKNAIISVVLSGDSSVLLETIKQQINNYPKPSLSSLMNILGTHDTARILTILSGVTIPNDRESASKLKLTDRQLDLAINRLKSAFILLFTLYGVPTVYYGDEAIMQGAKDPFNRCCMDFNQTNDTVYKLIKKLSKIRKENVEFTDGETVVLDAPKGVVRFLRVGRESEIEVIVNLSNYVLEIATSGEKELISNTKKLNYTLEKYSAILLKRRKI